MSRFLRLSSLAVLAAGVSLSAAIGVAANPYGTSTAYSTDAYRGGNDSQLTLVSATEEEPRAADPRGGSIANAPASKSAATTAKPGYAAPRSAAAHVAPRPLTRTAPRHPTPKYYPQRGGVLVSARVAVEPTRTETVLRPVPPPAQASEQPSPPPSPEMDSSMIECPTCPTCCDNCCGFCAGMEYLYLRPHFADDAAFERSTTSTTVTTVTEVNQVINFDEVYNSDYHFFLGYHNSCGDEFRFGYWHIADSGNRSGTASGDFLAGEGVAYQAPGGTQLTIAGEAVNATAHMRLNVYDLQDFKRIDLPSLGCGCCPEWDVRWSYGLRIVDFKHTVNVQDPIETINNDSYFTGGGPMIGLEVRRQLGHSKWSAYVSTTAALLLGEERGRSTTTTPGVLQTAVNMNIANGELIVPDFNISLGLTWQPWCHTTFTGGWMFEDFGNLGTAGATTCTTCSTASGAIGGGDLSFDGLFLRAEHCF